jgi:hypothetical protein
LDDKPLQTKLRYYGISPWEIEVLYGILDDKFMVVQEETEHTNPHFVSDIIITIPVQFSEEFFKWFGFKRWEKIKSLIKEMKRRRGNRKDIQVEIIFENEEWKKIHTDDEAAERRIQNGEGPILSDKDERLPDYPNVKFVIDSSENHIFNSAIEKIDVMVELLPYHLNHSKIKNWCKPMEVQYNYDVTFSKWYVGYVLSFDGGRTFGIDDLRG